MQVIWFDCCGKMSDNMDKAKKKSPGEFTHSVILVPSLGVVWFLFLWSLLILFTYMSDAGSIPELGRSAGGGHNNPLQYSCLGNPMDRGAWWATVHRVAKSRTRWSEWAHWFVHSVCVCVWHCTVYTVFFRLNPSSVGSFHVGACRFTSVCIYLAVLGLSCSVRDLWSSLWHVESSVAA